MIQKTLAIISMDKHTLKSNQKLIRNRRLYYLNHVLKSIDSDYFSDESIRMRHYDLYEQFILANDTTNCDIGLNREVMIQELSIRFLNGLDNTFDYTEIDENEQYNDWDQMERDNQDAYFLE